MTTTLIATHAARSAPTAAFFQRWADMATGTEWNQDTEWVRLDVSALFGARLTFAHTVTERRNETL